MSQPSTTASEPSLEFQFDLYRRMLLIRRFEERVKYLFLEGIMPGTIHQCQGQEACAVGVCSTLNEDDWVLSTHRPHGHCIAKGMSVKSMMAELFGKTTGCCKGKGGSMHMGEMSKGVIPAVAIVGGNIPIATGAALSMKMQKTRRVAVSFMGDGAVNEGAFHEGVNMGAIWKLPCLYVVENNLYGASTPVASVIGTDTIADRACAYGIPGERIDGNDVLAVYDAATRAVKRARAGDGPTLLELVTYRITGHSRRDPCSYQPEDERKKALELEPIGRFRKQLEARGVQADRFDQADQDAQREVEEAVQAAMADPLPAPEDTLDDLFVD